MTKDMYRGFREYVFIEKVKIPWKNLKVLLKEPEGSIEGPRLVMDPRENLLILVPLSQEHAKIFNMAKQISFQNYLPKTKHVCDTEC